MLELGRFISRIRKDKEANEALSSPEVITHEVAKVDIEKSLAVFETMGGGSNIDRAAQMVLQSLEVLERRLDKPEAIKILYLENPQASQMLPGVAMDTIGKLYNGEIDSDEAGKILEEAKKKYMTVFKEMGINPSKTSILFSKR